MGRIVRAPARRGLILVAALATLGCGEKAPPVTPGSVEGTAEVEADAGVDRVEAEQVAAIAAALNHYGPAVHTCWSRAAADDLRVEGAVTLRVVLGDGGKAAAVEVDGDEVGDEVLRKCLVELWTDVRWPELFATGDEIRLPPLSFVAPRSQYVVAAAHAVSYPLGKDGTSHATVLLDYKNSANSAVALTALSAAQGLVVPMHVHSSAEILYLLKGEGVLTDAGGVRRAVTVGAGTGIYIPAGAPHGFEATAAEPTVLLQLYAPPGPEQRFKGVDIGGTTLVERTRRSDPRPLVRAHSQAPSYVIAGGKGKVSMLFDLENAPGGGSSLAGITFAAGTAVPTHIHESSTEVIFIIEGGGTMTVDGVAREVARWDAIQVPPGVEHSFVAGAETVKAIQLYTPAGPEQRFKGK